MEFLNQQYLHSVLLESISEEIEKDSLATDVDIVNYCKQHGYANLDYDAKKKGAFLLTNGEMVYVHWHTYLESYGIGTDYGAIRLSKDCNAITIYKEPTPAQYEALQYKAPKFMGGSYELEIMVKSSFNFDKIASIIRDIYVGKENREYQINFELADLPRMQQMELRRLKVEVDQIIEGTYHMNLDRDLASFVKSKMLTNEQYQAKYQEFMTRLQTIIKQCNDYLGHEYSNAEDRVDLVAEPINMFLSNISFECAENLALPFLKKFYSFVNSAIEENKQYINHRNDIQKVAKLLNQSFEEIVTKFVDDEWDDNYNLVQLFLAILNSKYERQLIMMFQNIVKNII